MRWYSAYCFEVTVHHILTALSRFLMIFWDLTLFPDNSFYSFNLMELIHHISFRGYSTPNFDRVIAL